MGANGLPRDGPTTEEGGDPACWLHQVCEVCGAFIDHGEDHACPVRPRRRDGDDAIQTDTIEPRSTGPDSA
jgi:hypothetical protein